MEAPDHFDEIDVLVEKSEDYTRYKWTREIEKWETMIPTTIGEANRAELRYLADEWLKYIKKSAVVAIEIDVSIERGGIPQRTFLYTYAYRFAKSHPYLFAGFIAWQVLCK